MEKNLFKWTDLSLPLVTPVMSYTQKTVSFLETTLRYLNVRKDLCLLGQNALGNKLKVASTQLTQIDLSATLVI